MKISVLSYGTLALPEKEMYGEGDPDSILAFPSFGVLIEHPDGLILFDTGCPMDPAYPELIPEGLVTYTEEDTIPSRLAQLGYTPDDVKYVVLSHMHIDHAGDLHLFRNATFIAGTKEFETMTTVYDPHMPLGLFEQWKSPEFVWDLREEGVSELAPGVQIINFGPGHSFGMLALVVDSKDMGKLLLSSDIAYNYKILEGLLPLNVNDRDGFTKSVKMINKLVDEGMAVWYGHDIDQFKTLKLAPEGYYE